MFRIFSVSVPGHAPGFGPRFIGYLHAYQLYLGHLRSRDHHPHFPPTNPLFTFSITNLAPTVMSYTHPTASSSSNFQPIFDNALKAYERRTKKDLLKHPLAAQLQACDSPNRILALLQQQIQDLDRSQSSIDRLTKWLDPTVNVLYALSETIGEGVSLVCSRT